jgi:hypothetical protein
MCLGGLGASLALGADRPWEGIIVVLAAGALGATLSGVRTMRDSLGELRDLRAFAATMSIQPLVGACSGLLVFLLAEAGALPVHDLDLGPSSTRGLLAFIAGFSEPFLLGLVQRIAVISEKPPAQQTTS